ncbi:uncharacterized protein LOC129786293 [Lutzomyia longipalpis]|uniref:uncharacterized protein LOC129786293 n=1 Tax=Lutzomyia longipalpis TaxID=7200 RepID=UPI002483E8CA|nr:uncharacterized protein LOC129786293 [Lutzomyia longipalpis]
MSGTLNKLRLFGGPEVSSDDSSGSLTEVFYASTSDKSRSSTGSIPWAEDAIRQNQLEWERIERIFYGEEELPADPKTRQEFLEWMTAFPHLRVCGSQVPLFYDPERVPEGEEGYEEIFAIDPAPQRRRKSYISETRSGHVMRKANQMTFPPTSAIVRLSPKVRDIRNGGSVTYREVQRVPQRSRPKSPEKAVNLSTRLHRLDMNSTRPPRRETLLQSRSSNALLPGGHDAAAAVSLIRTEVPVYHPMPPILNLRLIYREREEPRTKASSVLLPAIDVKHLMGPRELATRSAINRRHIVPDPFCSPIQSASRRFKANAPIE